MRPARTPAPLARPAAAAGLLTLLAGVPTGLWLLAGWPLPRRVPTTATGWHQLLTGGFPDQAVVNLLTIALWLLWAAFTHSVWTEWRTTRSRTTHRRLPLPLSPVHTLAALLVATLTTGPLTITTAAAHTPLPATTLTAPTIQPPGTGMTQPEEPAPAAGPVTTATDLTIPAPTVGDTSRPPRFAVAGFDGRIQVQAGPHRYTCTVKRHDTLWDIAGAWLGDHHRWTEIYQLNATRYDRHGRMNHGHHIQPGWVLLLPHDATPPTTAQPAPHPPPSTQPEPAAPTPPPAGPTTPPTPTPTNDTDDGVAPPAPTPTTGPHATTSPTASTGPTATTGTPPTTIAPAPRPGRSSPPGVTLPNGGWVDLGLAAAIAAAATLVWLHRRRRYHPRPPSPQPRLDEPDLTPLPPVVTHLRHHIRTHAPTAISDAEQGPTGDHPPPPDPASARPPPAPAPLPPVLAHHPQAVRPSGGLGLTGPGAQAAARGLLVATLATNDPDHPPGQVIIPATTLATLLGAHAVTTSHPGRLTITTSLADALDQLEEHTLHRSRLVFDHQADTLTALRHTDPLAEAPPPLLLLADPTSTHEHARTAALLTQAQRLDIHAVLLTTWPHGTTMHVATDGTTTTDPTGRHSAHPTDAGRLTVLDPTQTADLLRTLAEAHTGQPQPAPPTEPPTPPNPDHHHHDPPPTPATATARDDEPTTPPTGDGGPPPGPPAPATHTPAPGTAGPAATPDEEPDPRADPHGPDPDTPADPGPPPARARVRVLGPPGIDNLTPPQQPGQQPLRSKALEVLVYLVAAGGHAPQHKIIADVLPDERHSRARNRLNTYISNLRTCLTRAGGPARYVAPPTDNYTLNRDALDIDLWRMQEAIATARTTTDPHTRTTALRTAAACYTGPLADGRDYEWVEPHREAIRRQAIDTHLALAQALTDEHPNQALTVLHTAITHDPYNETLYRHAMHLCARLGDLPGIRHLRHTLTRRMNELDTEPDEDTLTLADHLATNLQTHHRQPHTT